MPSNDVVLLQDILERSRGETIGLMSESEHHVYQVAKFYLYDFQPSHDDIMSGLVDGSRDGGLDAVYIYANGFCIRDDTPADRLGRNVDIDLIFLQVKNSSGFGEDAVDKLTLNLPRLLDLDRDEEALLREFSPRVIEVTRRFIRLFREAASPTLRIFTCFASLKAEDVHPNVTLRSEALEKSLQSGFRHSETVTSFLTAADLFDMASRSPLLTKKLTLAENPISTDMEGALVGLVRLSEFERFITDEYGRLESSIFDANVRDYEGRTPVNERIRATLQSPERDVDFWWLNNGITILASRVTGTTKQLSLDGPQIVNGLQTSHEIYQRTLDRGAQEHPSRDDRSVLVKIVQVSRQEIRERIIEATNSQTVLAGSALRATDRVQRQIELYLRKHELYYERRKNQYANSGIPLHKLVTIDDMGQALIATVLQMPHVSRSQSSRIFEADIYDDLFSPRTDVASYYGAIYLLRASARFLKERRVDSVDDYKFHLAMMLALVVTRRHQPKAPDLAKLNVSKIPELLPVAFEIVQAEFASVARRTGETLFERLAKSPVLSEALRERGNRYLRSRQ